MAYTGEHGIQGGEILSPQPTRTKWEDPTEYRKVLGGVPVGHIVNTAKAIDEAARPKPAHLYPTDEETRAGDVDLSPATPIFDADQVEQLKIERLASIESLDASDLRQLPEWQDRLVPRTDNN